MTTTPTRPTRIPPNDEDGLALPPQLHREDESAFGQALLQKQHQEDEFVRKTQLPVESDEDPALLRQKEDLRAEISRQRRELQLIRHKRQLLRQETGSLNSTETDNQATVHDKIQRVQFVKAQRQYLLEEELCNCQSLLDRQVSLQQQIEMSNHWTINNTLFSISSATDAHEISHDSPTTVTNGGPFATINGLRLGAEASVLVVVSSAPHNYAPTTTRAGANASSATSSSNTVSPLKSNISPTAAAEAADAAGRHGSRPIPGVTSPARRPAISSEPPLSSASPTVFVQQVCIRVPWNEINAALGQVVLLLSVLGQHPHSGIRYRHELHPQGSTSRVGIVHGPTGSWSLTGSITESTNNQQQSNRSITWYNLFSDDSFQFFGKRNFNTALECLAECIQDAYTAIQRRDRTIVLPYPITEKSITSPVVLVGGIPVTFDGSQPQGMNYMHIKPDSNGTKEETPPACEHGLQWTRAMKYLLTDLKHLMTFRIFGLWKYHPTPSMTGTNQAAAPSR